MKNILKVKTRIYIFNAFSNLNSNSDFISGGDRVGLKLLECEDITPIVIAPAIFKKLINREVLFYSSDNLKINNLFFRYIYRVYKTFFILKNILFGKKSEYEIISTSDFFPDTVPAFLFSKKANWYAFTFHLYPLKLNFRDITGRFLQLFSYLLFLSSYKVLTTNSECGNFLKKKFRINSIQIPLGLSKDTNSNNKSIKNRYSLVYLGRIKESKGIYDLPKIMSIVLIRFPDVTLKIIGNGSDKEVHKLKKMIVSFNLTNNIEIYQNLSDSHVAKILDSSYLMVNPSREEGFSLSTLEALWHNLNIVCFELPALKENFNDFDITYTACFNLDEFSQNIINCISQDRFNSYDKSIFNRYSWGAIHHKIFDY